jgi:outer membrane protein assembly factor BamB
MDTDTAGTPSDSSGEPAVPEDANWMAPGRDSGFPNAVAGGGVGPTPTEAWRVELGEIVGDPVIVDGQVHVGYDGIRTYDAEGQLVASGGADIDDAEMEDGGHAAGSVYHEGRLLYGFESGVAAYDPDNQEQAWATSLEGPPESYGDGPAPGGPPVVTDGVAVQQLQLDARNQFVMAVDAASGDSEWVYNEAEEITRGDAHLLSGRHAAADGIVYHHSTAPESIAFDSDPAPELLALDAQSGGVRWTVETEFTARHPVATGDALYTREGERAGVRRRAPEDGSVVWEWESPVDQDHEDIAVTGGTVYVALEERVYAIDAERGEAAGEFTIENADRMVLTGVGAGVVVSTFSETVGLGPDLTEQWRVDEGFEQIAAGGGAFYAANDELVALEPGE